MPPSPTFDAAIVTDMAAQVRLFHPMAAALIDDLWAEVQRLSAPDYVAPRPMTEKDHSGPFLGKPSVDVEFVDDLGNACGSSTVDLGIRINDRGILIISETRVGFVADHDLNVGGYRVWVGSDVLVARIEPVPIHRGDQYLLSLNLPIRLGRDIDHGPGGDRGPPRPNPPLPQTDKQKLKQEN